MKRFLVIGKTGCGKTSLLQRIFGRDLIYQKTQTVESFENAVDTPGEYLERKGLYHALIVTATDCDEILLLQAVDDENSSFPPGLDACFHMPVTGVITKADLAYGNERALNTARQILLDAGALNIFVVSAKTSAGLEALRSVVLEESCSD